MTNTSTGAVDPFHQNIDLARELIFNFLSRNPGIHYKNDANLYPMETGDDGQFFILPGDTQDKVLLSLYRTFFLVSEPVPIEGTGRSWRAKQRKAELERVELRLHVRVVLALLGEELP